MKAVEKSADVNFATDVTRCVFSTEALLSHIRKDALFAVMVQFSDDVPSGFKISVCEEKPLIMHISEKH